MVFDRESALLADAAVAGAFFSAAQHQARFAPETNSRATNNDRMVIPGRVHNGVVVLEGELALPEGATVSVTYPASPKAKPAVEKRRIEVPLVRTGQHGTVDLTGGRVAGLMNVTAITAFEK